MEEISQEKQDILEQEQTAVEKTKVRRTRKTASNEETTKEPVVLKEVVAEKNDTVDNVAEAASANKTKPTMGAVIKENNDNKNNHRRNQNQQKNNFKNQQNNKFTQQQSNANACPANLQRYRWWMGQLYQWRNISDVNSLNNLVNEVTDDSLPTFFLNEWYEKPLQELLKDIPEESQLASLTRQGILLEKMRSLSEMKHPICVEGVIAKVPNTEEWSVCYAFDNYQALIFRKHLYVSMAYVQDKPFKDNCLFRLPIRSALAS